MSKQLEFVFMNKYFVYAKPSKKFIGIITMNDTGEWVFWPEKALDGYWEYAVLEEIVNKLKFLSVQEAEKENKLLKEYEDANNTD